MSLTGSQVEDNGGCACRGSTEVQESVYRPLRRYLHANLGLRAGPVGVGGVPEAQVDRPLTLTEKVVPESRNLQHGRLGPQDLGREPPGETVGADRAVHRVRRHFEERVTVYLLDHVLAVRVLFDRQ